MEVRGAAPQRMPESRGPGYADDDCSDTMPANDLIPAGAGAWTVSAHQCSSHTEPSVVWVPMLSGDVTGWA